MGNRLTATYMNIPDEDDESGDDDDDEQFYDATIHVDSQDENYDKENILSRDLYSPESKAEESSEGKTQDKPISKCAQQMSVDVGLVIGLVAQVEELLSHLSNQDFQAAMSTADLLRAHGIGTQSE